MSLVADSGPILSFARAHRLELLRQVVAELFIPQAVYEDIVVRGAGKPGSAEVQASTWIRRLPVQDLSLVDRLPTTLHRGEREAIALAKERNSVIPQVKSILDELIAAGMYVGDELYQQFLQEIDEA